MRQNKILITAGTYAKIEMDYYLITEFVLWKNKRIHDNSLFIFFYFRNKPWKRIKYFKSTHQNSKNQMICLIWRT